MAGGIDSAPTATKLPGLVATPEPDAVGAAADIEPEASNDGIVAVADPAIAAAGDDSDPDAVKAPPDTTAILGAR